MSVWVFINLLKTDDRIAHAHLGHDQLLVLLDLIERQQAHHVRTLAEIGVDLDAHRSVEGAGVVGRPLAIDLQRALLVRVLAHFVEQTREQILEASLAQHARDQFDALLRAVDDGLDPNHRARLQCFGIEALGGVCEARSPRKNVVQKLNHGSHGLAQERRIGEHHGRARIAAGANDGAQIVVHRIVGIDEQLVDHGLRIDALGGAVEDRAHQIGFDALNVLGVVGQRFANDGVRGRIAGEQRELDPVRLFVNDDLALIADGADATQFRLPIAVLVDLDVPLAIFAAIAHPRAHEAAGIAQLRLDGEGGFGRLNVVGDELAIVTHGDQLIRRHDALVAHKTTGRP